ncbi:MAG TPA: nuclear transport factor 2 family protein [Candidatus Dormibacteraeota bacterium]
MGEKTVHLYIEGASKGDPAKLREAFHEDARMFGSLAGTRHDVPVTDLYEMAADMPADTGNYSARIVSLEQTGDAAAVALTEDGSWGTVSFVDYFLLARIDGTWKIVCKLFAHTGGEPPAR